MIRKFLHRFVRRRHYWRNVGFDELSELYASMMFRSLGMSLIAIFIPIYLYQHGHEVWEILFFYSMMFAGQLFCVPLAALLIARIGPKHTILFSYIIQIISLIGLIELNTHDVPLQFIALTMGAAMAFFFVAFNVDFSKVKHTIHGGKEVGWVYIMQKLGAILGPIVGGGVAFLFGSQYIFFVALALFVIGTIPLFMTQEPIKLRQKLDFTHLKVETIKWDILSFGAYSIENTISVVVWPLFIGVIVFRDSPYLQVGSAASISIVGALIAARMIGVLIDKKNGRKMLRYSAILNGIIHLFRPFTNGFSSVLATNIANEGVTVGYKLPYQKGVFDGADEHPGFRIVYIATLEAIGAFASLIFYMFAGLFATIYGPSHGLFIGFFTIAAISSFGITLERFRALK